jgi:hypothetical protein
MDRPDNSSQPYLTEPSAFVVLFFNKVDQATKDNLVQAINALPEVDEMSTKDTCYYLKVVVKSSGFLEKTMATVRAMDGVFCVEHIGLYGTQ